IAVKSMPMHLFLISRPAARRSRNQLSLHLLSVGIVAVALLVQAPYANAQHASPPQGMSDKQKAKIQEKRVFEKDTDDAYQTTINRMQDVKPQKVDPWGSVRTAPQK